VRWYRKAAEQGDAEAQFNLGAMYATGRGVRQNYAEAGKWFRQAAEQGYAEAQYNLGAMYFTGGGVHQDFHLSKEWFGKACDGGVQEGCGQYRYLNQKGY
ncbi:tetratricopeptide repeat protein, partial [Eikenella halliae]